MGKNSIILSGLILLQSCFLLFQAKCEKPGKTEKIVFSVMGDVPRSLQEDTLLQKQIHAHNLKSPSKMMFHVGDIKAGSDPCDEAVYQKVCGFLKKLDVPVFIVPGDNEWNDCENPIQAWKYWEKYFLKFDNNWKLKYNVEYQTGQQENFSFKINDILFVGINLVGGRIHDQKIWNKKIFFPTKL